MNSSFTVTEARTFTVTHARHMAAKVATDLKRIQRLYGEPNNTQIDGLQIEITELLKAGYLGTVTYGFFRNDRWIEPTLKYTARDLADMSTDDDDPGRIRPGANTDGAGFCSYLTYSSTWDKLSEYEKEIFKENIPFSRIYAPEPGIDGYLCNDRTYSSGIRALDRASVRRH